MEEAPMIHVVLGTKAQLIKMAPVMKALDRLQRPYRYISTGQHRETTAQIRDGFGLRDPDVVLYNGPDITSIPAMVVWTLRILLKTWRDPVFVFGSAPKGLVLVHGDTFSTLLGALMARFSGLKVGHVESGLRSFHLLHPFPEEITRLLVFQLSHLYFCPGRRALQNLSRFKGEKIDTGENTLRDALAMAMSAIEEATVDVPKEPYAVVSIHRFENIYTKTTLNRVIEAVLRIAGHIHVLFILHKPTERKLREFGFYERLASRENIEIRQRYDYFSFIKLLTNADFAVSDGGSNQEECHYLGKPVLLLRMATEREEGMNENCVLSKFDDTLIDEFIASYKERRGDFQPSTSSPSDIIARSCAVYG